jgi:drug/metabolite transporter (DMT)-like permease
VQTNTEAGRPDFIAGGAAVLMALIFSVNWVALKQITGDASPFVMSAMRVVAASAALFLAAAVFRRPLGSPPPWPTFVAGMLQTGFFVILQNLALLTGGAGKTAVLTYTMPLWVVLIAPFWLGERITVPRAVALVLGLAGLACVLAPFDLQHAPLAKAFALLTAIIWAFGVLYTKQFRTRHPCDTLTFTAWQMIYTIPPLVLLALIVPGGFVHPSPHFWLLFTQVSAGGTAVAFLLFMVVIARLSASDAGLASLLTPALTVVVAWLVLGEQPTTIEILGTVLILAGLAINSAPHRIVPWLLRSRAASP